MMMNVEYGKYIGLTETGARIWELLEEPQTADYICTELCREYAVAPDVCRAKMDAFVVDMTAHRALVAD
jgi:hypothetical protein